MYEAIILSIMGLLGGYYSGRFKSRNKIRPNLANSDYDRSSYRVDN